MGRFRTRMYEEYAQEFKNDESFERAYKKVKKIKGFYSHLKVYIIINVLIIISNLDGDFFGWNLQENSLLDWHTYSTAFYWGIALLIHAFTVFGPDIFFNGDWEQKKIQEYMDKEASNTNKWE
ncbi:2TM domain-containing protein [Flavobacterium saccharophilum]|uniref:2TM domain-containing protein n=1 Tax=Flavobacterium saccharophilum TaxID=29534 RepID=A0A1M7GJA3_9FLAO|nr:2TM domain-containing protein [Flavobacterium saccharophilum]SHM16208.1 2TM domain-containing protein [Flavobacterium saccharophilum]